MEQVRIVISADAQRVQQAVRQANVSLQQMGRGTDAASRASDALGASIARVGHYAAAAFAADRVLSMVGELGRAQQAAEALSQSLSYSAGSKSVSRELAYLAEVTNRLGVEYVSASKAYASFAAATKGTGISAEQTRTIFEGVAQAAAKLGLSAEELRGQLGE